MITEFEHVPTTDSDRRALIANKPEGWEYMLLASTMLERLRSYEPRLWDYRLHYVPNVGRKVGITKLADLIGDRMSVLSAKVRNASQVISPEVQAIAFGYGTSEDPHPELIVHLASRIVDGYGSLLDWAEELMSLRLPNGTDDLRLIMGRLVARPISEYEEFVQAFARQVDQIPVMLAADHGDIKLSMTLSFSIDEELTAQLISGMDQLLRDVQNGKWSPKD